MIKHTTDTDTANVGNDTNKRHSQHPAKMDPTGSDSSSKRQSQHPGRLENSNQEQSSGETHHQDESQVDAIIHDLDGLEQQRTALIEQLRSTRESLASKLEEIDQRLDVMEGNNNSRSNRSGNNSNQGSRRSVKRNAADGNHTQGGNATPRKRGRPAGSKNASRSVKRNSSEGDSSGNESSGAMRQRSAREGGLVSYLKEAFQKTNKAMTVNELREALQETEWKSNAKQPYQIIYTALTSHGDIFKKVEGERGTFKLA